MPVLSDVDQIQSYQLDILLELSKYGSNLPVNNLVVKPVTYYDHTSEKEYTTELDLINTMTNSIIAIVNFRWDHIRFKPRQKDNPNNIKAYQMLLKTLSKKWQFPIVDYM